MAVPWSVWARKHLENLVDPCGTETRRVIWCESGVMKHMPAGPEPSASANVELAKGPNQG